MRYRPILAGKDEIFRIQKGYDNYSDYLRRKLIKNHEALFYIDVRNDDIIMLFMVKNILIQLSPLAIQISKPYKILTYSSKKECEICNESRTQFFRSCCRCKKTFCNTCYIKMHLTTFSCPFCRFSLESIIDEQLVV